jgi:TatD DNase family protein
MLIDTHAHYDFDEYTDLDEVLAKCKSAGVGIIISNGTNQKSNEKTLSLAKKYSIIKPALGLYPSDALQITDKEIEKSLEFIRKNKDKIIAIGEVGIDFFHIKDAKERARECEIFTRVIKLANSINKPLIVHSRKAEGEVLELLQDAKVPVVLHFYCGNATQIEEAVKRGYYFSIPTAVVVSKTLKKLVKRVPLDKLFTETDAPYLCPVEGKNDSSYIKLSLNKIAEVKGISAKELEKQIEANFKHVFGLYKGF